VRLSKEEVVIAGRAGGGVEKIGSVCCWEEEVGGDGPIGFSL
jgi:hypothetical protein